MRRTAQVVVGLAALALAGCCWRCPRPPSPVSTVRSACLVAPVPTVGVEVDLSAANVEGCPPAGLCLNDEEAGSLVLYLLRLQRVERWARAAWALCGPAGKSIKTIVKETP